MPWPDTRIVDLLHVDVPILLAPMAGAGGSELAIAVAEGGGLGSLPCALLSPAQAHGDLATFRQRTSRPVNLNFFCHQPPAADAERDAAWRNRLESYYLELGLDPHAPLPAATRMPFDAAMCDVVVEQKPEVVSFHFGLPAPDLLARVKETGAKILSTATTVEEARWLDDRGCDAIIAQGYEAGGHRGMFLTQDLSSQAGTFSLVPQVADAVKVPVIAAGGIADARGIAAAFALGASAVQIGTAYLFCPESTISPVHRRALQSASEDRTALTNVFSGRPARAVVNRVMRETGPISGLAPPFPLAGAALAPLRRKSEGAGSEDFAQMWSGQSARLGRAMPASELTARLAAEALAKLSK